MDIDRDEPNPLPSLAKGDEAAVLQFFRFSLENAPDGVFWMDRDGRFYYANAQACRSLGYTRQELTQLHLWDIDPVYSKEDWEKSWAEGQLSPEPSTQHIETFHRRKDGVLFPVEITSRHICLGETEFHVAFSRDISDRKRIEEDLNLTQSAIDRAATACSWIGSDGQFAYVNDRECQCLGYSREELLGMSVQDIDPEFSSGKWDEFWQELQQQKVLTFETLHRRKNGTTFPLEITANYLEFGGKSYSCAFERDLTEWKRAQEERDQLEGQLLQAQKLEAIGRLAGGVAHDFNNMLSVILGYVDLITERLAPTDSFRSDLKEIERAALRSQDLTQQLLAFSRRQVVSPRMIHLNALLEQFQKTLGRLIGEDVELIVAPGEDLWAVRMDSTQVDQILVNLAVNARDAMPDGGTLTIRTDNVDLSTEACSGIPDCKPGSYVQLTVRDTGGGMDQDTLTNIFEPFFTTKEFGVGTGLGLATVYGIVRQNEGFIDVSSETGKGTTFTIYLPRFVGEDKMDAPTVEDPAGPGQGTVLLVEDEPMVREMVSSMLGRLGYTVLVAATPTDALFLLKKADCNVDLLLTDVVMPGMKGTELRDEARNIDPRISVLFMSGYTANVIAQHGVLEEGVHFIQKPFSTRALSRKLQAILAEGAS